MKNWTPNLSTAKLLAKISPGMLCKIENIRNELKNLARKKFSKS